MRRTRAAALPALLAALALALVPAGARATLMEAMDLRELVAEADHVVLGTVLRSEARYDDRDRIVTDATVRVEESLHGGAAAGARLVMRQLGGALGDVGLRVEGEPSLAGGERVVLFLRAVGGVLRPVGMSQGVLPVRSDATGTVVMPGGDGLSLVERGGDGRLHPAQAALAHPEPLEDLLARIRELVAEIHGGR